MTTIQKANTGLIVLSFFFVYVCWGTTYLTNAWAVEAIPPFLLSGARFVLAGLTVIGIIRLYNPIQITKIELQNAAFGGFLLFAVGNGSVVWALQYVDSGLTALIISSEPIIVAFFLWTIKGKQPILLTWLGILCGIFGMFLLVGQPQIASDASSLWGLAAIFLAMIAWGYSTIWIPTAKLPKNVFLSAAFQMLLGGLMMLVLSIFQQEWVDLNWSLVNTKVQFSFLYLTIFGSILTFTAFNYLLLHVSPTKVVTSSYVHPVIALFCGWWLNNEIIHPQSLMATFVLLVSVFLINKAKEKI